MNVTDKIKLCLATKCDTLNLSKCNLTIIPENIKYVKHIKTLNLSNNKIIKIENIPINVETLCLDNNEIEHVKTGDIPVSVTTLNLSKNYIKHIDSLPISLLVLNVSQNRIRNVAFLKNLINLLKLEMSCNNISNMDVELSPRLTYLDVSSNMISRVPQTQHLQELHITSNRIVKLNNLPKSLFILDASKNEISVINSIPAQIVELNLSHNEIRFLPILPNSLSILKLSNNKMKAISGIPIRLKHLNISHNELVCLPDLSFIDDVKTDGNPLLIDNDSDGYKNNEHPPALDVSESKVKNKDAGDSKKDDSTENDSKEEDICKAIIIHTGAPTKEPIIQGTPVYPSYQQINTQQTSTNNSTYNHYSSYNRNTTFSNNFSRNTGGKPTFNYGRSTNSNYKYIPLKKKIEV
jgi:Leucine-rich repeat (LRR) protein